MLHLEKTPADAALTRVLEQAWSGRPGEPPKVGVRDGVVIITTAADFAAWDTAKVRFKTSPSPEP